MKTRNLTYQLVIQQKYASEWEDVEEIETNSMFVPLEHTTQYVSYLTKEYRLLGYSTRVIKRRLTSAKP